MRDVECVDGQTSHSSSEMYSPKRSEIKMKTRVVSRLTVLEQKSILKALVE